MEEGIKKELEMLNKNHPNFVEMINQESVKYENNEV
jgi:hypothetical protein